MSVLPFIHDLQCIIHGYIIHRKYQTNVSGLIRAKATLFLTTWLEKNKNILVFNNDTFSLAAEFGYLNVVQCIGHDPVVVQDAIYEAARYGQLDILRWLYISRRGYCDSLLYVVNLSSQNGHLDIVKWMCIRYRHELSRGRYQFSKPFTGDSFSLAAKSGHFKIVKWLWYNTVIDTTLTSAIDWCAHWGHFEIIKWMYTNCKIKYTYAAIVNAVAGGYFDIVKWLDSERPDMLKTNFCFTSALHWAQQYGYTEIINWLESKQLFKT